ncbi:MAG: TonB-dependent receptor [Chthoniobacteraceae bacterium]
MPARALHRSLAAFLFVAAQAQDAPPLVTLAPVIVTATQTEETVFETPYTAHVVSSKRFLDERSVRTLVDALSETPGVLVQRTGYAQASPFLRGFTGYRTLTLIDGIRLNNATFREGPNQYFATVDAFTIDRIEIVKGPSSVLYGSDAIGGAVNLMTRDPQMLPWPETPMGKDAKSVALPERFAMHGGAHYRYSTAENSHIARGEFGFALGPQLGVLGGITRKDFDDLHGGDLVGTQSKSGYGEVDGDLKVVYRIDKDTDLTAAFYRTEQNNAPRWHSTKYSDKGFDGLADGTDLRRDLDQERELAYLKYEQRDVASWLNSVRFSFSFHRQAEEQDRIRDTRRRDVDGFQDDQYGFVLNLESPSPIGTLSYGIEYYHDNVESWGSRWNEDGSLSTIKPRGPFSDEGAYDQLGVYVQDRFKPVEPLEITLGVRYSWAEARGGIVDDNPLDSTTYPAIDKTFDALTASARFRLDVARDWNFFGGVSQGFRAPTLADLTSFDIARSGERETPAPNLSPEHFVAFEIGTKLRCEKLRLETYAAYFHTLIDNQIIRYPTGRLVEGDVEVQKANVGDGFIHGVEFGAEWNFRAGFTLFGNLTWTEGELDTYVGRHITARPASRIQPLTGLIGLRWQSADQRWFAETTAEFARRQDRLSPGDMADTQRIPPGGTKGYQVFSVRAGWEPRDWLQVTAALENIGDEDYRYLGSGINEAGTNFIVSTRLRF